MSVGEMRTTYKVTRDWTNVHESTDLEVATRVYRMHVTNADAEKMGAVVHLHRFSHEVLSEHAASQDNLPADNPRYSLSSPFLRAIAPRGGNEDGRH